MLEPSKFRTLDFLGTPNKVRDLSNTSFRLPHLTLCRWDSPNLV